jgi:hypothetical protein
MYEIFLKLVAYFIIQYQMRQLLTQSTATKLVALRVLHLRGSENYFHVFRQHIHHIEIFINKSVD